MVKSIQKNVSAIKQTKELTVVFFESKKLKNFNMAKPNGLNKIVFILENKSSTDEILTAFIKKY